MRAKRIPANGFGWVIIALAMLACGRPDAQAADMKLQAFLLWGTDESKPPAGKAYQPVEPDHQVEAQRPPAQMDQLV